MKAFVDRATGDQHCTFHDTFHLMPCTPAGGIWMPTADMPCDSPWRIWSDATGTATRLPSTHVSARMLWASIAL
ncbi:MAG: hypothetical protein ACKORL_11490 [Phycisphaerales bacterium]